ncbi:MAG: FtsQ-type POTRA domain-containing protein [Acidobacteria bacterium]|nr:FtsQ-type POTRA domain-containing protein [Acidobacteriota bacterium]
MGRGGEAAVSKSRNKAGGLRPVRILLVGMAAVICAAILIMTWMRLEQFLMTDRRFMLPGPPDPGHRVPQFRIEGSLHASELQVTQVFFPDFGRSVYLCPLSERRRQLLAIDWVKDATVSRIWPNRLLVRITERSPVAFVQIPAGGAMRFALIDQDGVMLMPHDRVSMKLPVLTGLCPGDPRESRKDRVGRLLELRDDIGPMLDTISEVDVSDPENLKVSLSVDGRALVLMIGNRRFLERLQKFRTHYPAIRKHLPQAGMLDLRLPDRITAVERSEIESGGRGCSSRAAATPAGRSGRAAAKRCSLERIRHV